MNSAVLAILGASVLGSVHCAAMCGGFACFASAGSAGANATRAHVSYNVGRLLSYLLLGALGGLVGAGVTGLGVVAGIGRAATLMAGMLMVMWGASALLAARGVHVGAARAPESWQRMIGGLLQRVGTLPSGARALATGLATTLLPCGWLYVFVATAAGTGSMLRGMLVMFVFWVGTLPALLAVAAGSRRLVGPFARRMPAVAAMVVVIIGLLTLAGRLRLDVTTSHAVHVAHVEQP